MPIRPKLKKSNKEIFILAFMLVASLKLISYNSQLPTDKQPIVVTSPHPKQQPEPYAHHSATSKPPPKTMRPLNDKGGRASTQLVPLDEPINYALASQAAGQVTADSTDFGEFLRRLVVRDDVTRIVETGTWKGAGSTLTMAASLEEAGTPKDIYTIEAFKEMYDIARAFLAKYSFVHCLYGTAVGVNGLSRPEPDRWTKVFGTPEWSSWLEQDRQKLVEMERAGLDPILDQVCKEYKPDFALLDGSEFTGYAEWKVVEKHCKELKYVALHDANTVKHMYTVEELNKPGSGWTKIGGIIEKSSGVTWAVYERFRISS